jgi:hypothetical protein
MIAAALAATSHQDDASICPTPAFRGIGRGPSEAWEGEGLLPHPGRNIFLHAPSCALPSLMKQEAAKPHPYPRTDARASVHAVAQFHSPPMATANIGTFRAHAALTPPPPHRPERPRHTSKRLTLT